MNKISDDDFKALFPGKTHMLAGKFPIELRPAGISVIQLLSKRVIEVTSALDGVGITLENCTEGDNLAVALPVIMDTVPEVLAALADMDIEDLKRIPIGDTLQLALDVIEVNYDSIGYFQKNLQSLATILIATRNLGLGTSSKS